MKTKAIYFDYAATTPVDPRVAKKMHECLLLDGNFGKPGLGKIADLTYENLTGEKLED